MLNDAVLLALDLLETHRAIEERGDRSADPDRWTDEEWRREFAAHAVCVWRYGRFVPWSKARSE